MCALSVGGREGHLGVVVLVDRMKDSTPGSAGGGGGDGGGVVGSEWQPLMAAVVGASCRGKS